jgi:hypothetical protein
MVNLVLLVSTIQNIHSFHTYKNSKRLSCFEKTADIVNSVIVLRKKR